MTLDKLRELCLSFPGAYEKMPFTSFPTGADILCFYVGPKIFCLTNIFNFEYFNLKGVPEDNIELCERYASIKPGWHMNKDHWITVYADGDVADNLIERLVHKSYDLVFGSLPRKVKEDIMQRKELR